MMRRRPWFAVADPTGGAAATNHPEVVSRAKITEISILDRLSRFKARGDALDRSLHHVVTDRGVSEHRGTK